jgi:hypothetical protein
MRYLLALLLSCSCLADGYIDVVEVAECEWQATARTSTDGTNVYLSITLPAVWTNYTIMQSANLVDWWPMGSVTNNNTVNLIVVSHIEQKRFYRVRNDDVVIAPATKTTRGSSYDLKRTIARTMADKRKTK